jgi:hypothetical protein
MNKPSPQLRPLNSCKGLTIYDCFHVMDIWTLFCMQIILSQASTTKRITCWSLAVPLRPCLLHRSPPPLPLSPQDARPRGEDKSPPETLHHCRAHFSAATRCNDTLFQTAISGTSNVAEAGEPERQSVVVRSKKALICNLNPPHYERGVHTAPPHPTSPWLRRFRAVRIQKSSLNKHNIICDDKAIFYLP